MDKLLAVIVACCSLCLSARAAEVSVAVAANFSAPMKVIAPTFERETGHKLLLSFGSTGNFYAQIKNGAPYQVLLAADDETPIQLESEALGVRGSRFTYAVGTLVLWSKRADRVDAKGEVLRNGSFQRLAIANPKLAPYGAAAVQTMTQLGLLKELQPKWVQGENIAQTYQFIATENAELGFVALSQVMAEGKISQGSAWVVPASLHSPIRQDAIVLARGDNQPAVLALMRYLRSDRTQALIRSFGYAV